MVLIQLLIALFVAFAIIKIILRLKRKGLTFYQALAWIAFWLLVAGIVLHPQSTGFFAQILGVGRGVDVVIYISIIVAFYLLFKMQIKLEKIERDITKIVRDQSLRNPK